MDRITEAAGVSKRTVYNYFESKAELFKETINVLANRLKRNAVVKYYPEKPLRAQLLDLGNSKADVLRSQEFMQLVRMAMSETLRDPNTSQALKQKSEVHSEFSEFFEDAIKHGAFRCDDPKKIEDQFIGLIKARAFWPAIFDGSILSPDEMKQVVEESADTILAAFSNDK